MIIVIIAVDRVRGDGDKRGAIVDFRIAYIRLSPHQSNKQNTTTYTSPSSTGEENVSAVANNLLMRIGSELQPERLKNNMRPFTKL